MVLSRKTGCYAQGFGGFDHVILKNHFNTALKLEFYIWKINEFKTFIHLIRGKLNLNLFTSYPSFDL